MFDQDPLNAAAIAALPPIPPLAAKSRSTSLQALAENFEIREPDADGLVWLVLRGKGTTGQAMFNLGTRDKMAAQVALMLEQDRRAALAAKPLQQQLDEMTERKDGAYLERNQCVALLARMALAIGCRAGLARTAIEGWSDDWHGCVYIDLPTGQVSWHFHDSQASLFDGLPPYTGKWDGHDTPEKYRRVAGAFADGAVARARPFDEGTDILASTLRSLDQRLRDGMAVPLLVGEAYDSFYQETVEEALATQVPNSDRRSVMLQLHPMTAVLVASFTQSLAAKLLEAQKKYGYTDGWARADWMDECRRHLREHLEKGDPRDVAAYAAFLWWHGARTAA